MLFPSNSFLKVHIISPGLTGANTACKADLMEHRMLVGFTFCAYQCDSKVTCVGRSPYHIKTGLDAQTNTTLLPRLIQAD